MARILVYFVVVLLFAAIGFVIAVPPELRSDYRDAKRLDTFIQTMRDKPGTIGMVELVNGQSSIRYRMADKEDKFETTVVPVEWKGQLVQQMIDKHVSFTVRDPDYSWLIAAAVAVVGVVYFRFVMLPRWSLRQCSHCAEQVHCSARICRYCRAELLPITLQFGSADQSEVDEFDDESENADDDENGDDDDGPDDHDPDDGDGPDGGEQSVELESEPIAAQDVQEKQPVAAT